MKTVFVSLFLACLLATTAHGQTQREVNKVVNGAGFVPLLPPLIIENTPSAPNLTWRPGYVFRIVSFDKGKKGIRTVCNNFFVRDFSKPAGWITPDRDATKKGSFGLTASLLGPAGSISKGSAGLKFDWDKHTVVQFSELTKLELSDEDLGVALEPSKDVDAPISKACEKALRKLRGQDKKFKEKIYFVTDAAISPKFRVAVDKSLGAEIGLDVDFNKLVTVKPGYKNTTVTKEEIVHESTDAPAFLGFRALVIDKVLMKAGAVGPDVVRATVSSSSLSPADVEALTEVDSIEK